jgi:hypothetical protein
MTMGWEPEGSIYFQYEVSTKDDAFSAAARADLDGNLTPQIWGFVLPGSDGDTADIPFDCDGIYDPQSQVRDLTESIGPCEASHGQTVF